MTGNSSVYSTYFTQLLTLARGYMSSRIFLTALELGIFIELENEPLTASQIAERLDTDNRAMEILLHALAGMNLLEKKGNVFVNIKEVADLLIPGGAHYRGGLFDHTVNLWQAWSRLTEIIRSGHPGRKGWTDKMKLDLALAMKQQTLGKSDRLAALVDCSGASSMLDLGGGPGSYGIAFARRYPSLKVVILDRNEQAREMARKEIEGENLQHRISLNKGDFFLDDIGRDYDLVLLSSIICLFGEAQNSFLFRKVKESLKDSGRVVVWDLMLDESKTRPASATIFAVNMLVNTQDGRSYSFSEVKGLLQSSGFKDIYRIPMDDSQVVIGRK